jgi:hypothetical protein
MGFLLRLGNRRDGGFDGVGNKAGRGTLNPMAAGRKRNDVCAPAQRRLPFLRD